jgi:hypothetical protein
MECGGGSPVPRVLLVDVRLALIDGASSPT